MNDYGIGFEAVAQRLAVTVYQKDMTELIAVKYTPLQAAQLASNLLQEMSKLQHGKPMD